MSCSMELVQMLDEIDQEENKKLKFALKNSEGREEEQIDENNKLKCEVIYLKCMMKNMLLSLVATQNDDLEWKIKRDYGMNYSDEYNKYKDTLMKEQLEEMNDTDWNETEPSIKSVLEYNNSDSIMYLHFNEDDKEE
tara:strand:+ start:489 stop:899 length:411 start_codon:yes stop_codon:yes gene_type:complete